MSRIVNGLERKVTKGKLKVKPYAVLTIMCSHCGTQGDYKDTELICPRCKSDISKDRLKAQPVTTAQTASILSNEIKWECKTCGKRYDTPNACCLEEFAYKDNEINGKDVSRDPLPAFQCSECLILYKIPVICHSGANMFQGKILPNRTPEDFEKIKVKMTQAMGEKRPILGVVQ